MTFHFLGFVRALQWKVAKLWMLYVPKPPLSVKWCGHASVFHLNKMPTLTHNRANSYMRNIAIILNIIILYLIFVTQKLYLVVLLSKADDFHHYINIRFLYNPTQNQIIIVNTICRHLYRIIGVYKKTGNYMGTVCSDDLLKNVPSEYHKYLSIRNIGC